MDMSFFIFNVPFEAHAIWKKNSSKQILESLSLFTYELLLLLDKKKTHENWIEMPVNGRRKWSVKLVDTFFNFTVVKKLGQNV